MPRPKNIKQLQRFLGMVNYYRRIFQGLAYLTEPLLINLRTKGKEKEFKWEEKQEKAFKEIIECLAKEPILKLPDYDKEFMLKTDASALGFGGALVQIHDGK